MPLFAKRFLMSSPIRSKPAVMKPAYKAGASVSPTCLTSDSVPSAVPLFWPAVSDTSTFSGAPSRNPKPIPAMTLAVTNSHLSVTHNGNRLKPTNAMAPDTTAEKTGPFLSVIAPPSHAPIPDANASGVIQ
ncbi:hypothetical protein MUS_0861 [Bacillus velezensis YAU B9601-Y2]|uniref:Uncharacterized protein n=1 Tax=Bacillus amyloliquefaciens (strain Y2) TaxID=1155777 RepID=I2C2N4_BACAY|nr:hypothetical protein MUS_0861 [Bacillus velezensis YAU B9601-Y2]